MEDNVVFKNIFLYLTIFLFTFNAFAVETKTITIFGDKITESDAKQQANIIILTSEEIQRINPRDTYELLEMIPGINIKSYDRKNVTVNIGGFVGDKAGLNNVLMINGRKISNADMSSTDLTLIPVDVIERVEVYLGSNSVLFGDRATGGVINIITKKPISNSFKIKTNAGSYGSYNAYAEGVLAGERYSFLLSGNKYGTQGYRDNSELYTGTLNGEFTYYADRFDITFNGLYTDSTYGLPGALSLNEIATYGRKYTNRPNDGGHDYEWLSGVRVSYHIGSLGKIILDSQYKSRNRNYELWGNHKDELKSNVNSIKYELGYNKNRYKNKLIAGIDIENYDLDTKSVYSLNKLERDILSFFVSDKVELDKFYIEFGFRTSGLDDSYKSANESKNLSANAYNIGIGYSLTKNQNIYFRYDKSFRFPTTDEINEYSGLNTEITKQDTKTYEIGYKVNYVNYYISASAYKQTSDNEIFTDPDFNWSGPANLNFDTRKYVFNFNGGYDNKQLLIKASYNYIDSKLTEDGYNGKTVPLVSRHNVKSTAGYRFENGVGLYYDFRYFSSYYKGNDYKNVDSKMGGYAISDIKVDFVTKNYELFLKVNNIFDKKYYDYVYYSVYGSGYYPSTARSFLAGISVKF
ncbi:MAG: TonB-dependent receptor plug [Deferribacteraceae bacterium]|jgi:iron complex outermembrane receptor protein|nr:TonB-dependent receptor plug [Deferribacteraceae bacterium]